MTSQVEVTRRFQVWALVDATTENERLYPTSPIVSGPNGTRVILARLLWNEPPTNIVRHRMARRSQIAGVYARRRANILGGRVAVCLKDILSDLAPMPMYTESAWLDRREECER